MRALSVPVVLSSVVLTGWLGGAAAQDMNTKISPGSSIQSTLEQAACEQNQQPLVGVIPQPNPYCPGLVTGITLGELYTDNLKLAASGKPKQTSWITQVQPFIKSAYSSPRFSGIFDYALTGYLYTGGSSRDQLVQNLEAQGTLAVVEQHLFIDGTALYGREVINNELTTGSGTFFLNNNNANVGRWTLSPYWLQDLGRVGTMTLRYTYGRVVYNKRGIPEQSGVALAGVSDVTSNGVQFSVVSPVGEEWGWDLEYSQQRLQPDAGPGVEYAVAKAGASLQINPTTRLLADAGKENRYLPDGGTNHLDASFWDGGFEWSNTRDYFKLLVGHRFYGRNTQLAWTHQAALLTTTVSYDERPTDLNQQLLGQNPGQIVVTPGGNIFVPSLRNRQIYLMKRATATAAYEMPRGRLTVTLYDESRRYFMLQNVREKVANADVAWSFDLGPYTTFTPRIGWQRFRFLTGQVTYRRYGELALVHQVNPDNFGSLRLRNDSSDVYSPIPGAHGYRVNVVFAQWTHLF